MDEAEEGGSPQINFALDIPDTSFGSSEHITQVGVTRPSSDKTKVKNLKLKLLKLSIVIPNYNYDDYIGQTIESVIDQNYADLEVIIVDDGSTDNSFQIIEKYKERYPHIIKTIQQQNMGQAQAINTGLKLATGDVVGWINSDDTYCKNAFNAVMTEFQKHNKIDVLFGDINIIDVNGRHIFTQYNSNYPYLVNVFTGFANNISSNAVFWRRSLLNTVGFLSAEFKCGLDNDLFSRITFGANVVHIRKTLANFRKQPITKAAINNADWEALVREEARRVFVQSYSRTWLGRHLPSKYAIKLRPIFIAGIRLKKILYGTFFKNLIEKWKYNRSS